MLSGLAYSYMLTCMPNTRLNTRPNYDPTRYAMVHESARTVACGVLID